MPAYLTTLHSTKTNVPANVATKVPAAALSGRLMVRYWNPDSAAIFWGGPGVDSTTGIPIAPGDFSPWIPTSDNTYLYSAAGVLAVPSVEGA